MERIQEVHSVKKLKVTISPTAQIQYHKIREYLIKEWPKKVVLEFDELVDQKIDQVAYYPKSYKISKKEDGIYQAVLEKHSSFYYRIKNDIIEILIFVDNRMKPAKKDKQLKNFGL